MSETFTTKQYKAFERSVLDCESKDQLRRISGRMAQRKMVDELGKEICDAMWKKFIAAEKKRGADQ